MSYELDKNDAIVLSLCTYSDQKEIQEYLDDVLPDERPDFPTLIGGHDVFKAFKARGYPSNFIVDKQGAVRFFHWNLTAQNLKRFKQEMEALVMEEVD